MFRKRKLTVVLLSISLFTIQNSFGQYTKLSSGFDNMVRCVEYDSTNNLLYAGGNFYYEGLPPLLSNPVNKIAVWDGNSWDSLGSGVTQPGFLVDLAMYNGNLLAAGSYNGIGGISSMGLSLWDGISWQNFADLYHTSLSGNYGSANVIKVINNELYVGGGFNRVNGTIANGLAKFDGVSWTVFPYIDNDAQIADIAFYNNELYIGGNFFNGNSNIEDLAKFDGLNWVPVSGWNVGAFDGIYSLEVFQNKLIVGGGFTNLTGAPGNNIAAWDGNSWSTMQGGLDHHAWSMKPKDSLLYVSGMFTMAGGQSAYRIATWDGNNWSKVGLNDSLNGAIVDFAFGNTTLFVGGNFTKINGDTINFVAKMDLSTSLFENLDQKEILEVYPNPNNGIFTINFPNFKFNENQFEILNFLGVPVFNGIINTDELTINLSGLNLPPGLYLFRIKAENEYAFCKIIIN